MEPKRSSSSSSGGKQAEYYAEKLSDPSLGKHSALPENQGRLTNASRPIDPKFKVQQACELRDSIEVFQATDYQRFLSKLVPIFLKILGDGQPIFVSTIPEQVFPHRIEI